MGKYLVFRNSSSLLLNGYSIYGLCLTFWTNEFLGSYSNYKFIISFSILIRMDLWRILCSQSIIEEVLQFSFSNPIFPFHFSKRFLWSHSNSLSLFSSNSFRGLFSLTSRQSSEACALLTPLHIVPEWYFLCQYAMLKAVPNKNAGF